MHSTQVMLKFSVLDLFEGRVAPEVEKTFSPAKKPFLLGEVQKLVRSTKEVDDGGSRTQ